ncbi:MAG: hypothetical protein ACO2ZX_12410 [Paracoccaceae bacterium]
MKKCVFGVKEEELLQLELSLNRLAEDGAWDTERLKSKFEQLIDYNVDLTFTGFEIAACMEAIFEHEPVKSWIKDALKEDEFLTFNKPYRADENPNQITKMKRFAY